jgi:Peptidase_C39 like family
VPEVAAGTYDAVYRGHGNWPFNTAFAARAGLEGYVSRFSTVGQLERWVQAGVPVVASIAWRPGELANAPIGSTSGHLLVVVGFSPEGHVVVNEPAADPRVGQSVRRTYDRRQFEQLWLRASGGTVYLIHPVGWSRPSLDAFGAW